MADYGKYDGKINILDTSDNIFPRDDSGGPGFKSRNDMWDDGPGSTNPRDDKGPPRSKMGKMD